MLPLFSTLQTAVKLTLVPCIKRWWHFAGKCFKIGELFHHCLTCEQEHDPISQWLTALCHHCWLINCWDADVMRDFSAKCTVVHALLQAFLPLWLHKTLSSKFFAKLYSKCPFSIDNKIPWQNNILDQMLHQCWASWSDISCHWASQHLYAQTVWSIDYK